MLNMGDGIGRWFWCKYLRLAQQGQGRSKDYAASTAFQIAGAVWFLRRRRPKANCPLRIRRSSSTPAMGMAAQSKFLKPSIGPVRDLIPWHLAHCSLRCSVAIQRNTDRRALLGTKRLAEKRFGCRDVSGRAGSEAGGVAQPAKQQR